MFQGKYKEIGSNTFYVNAVELLGSVNFLGRDKGAETRPCLERCVMRSETGLSALNRARLQNMAANE